MSHRTLDTNHTRRYYRDDSNKLIPVVSLDPATTNALAIAEGLVPGVSTVQKFGYNNAVITTGTGADIWSGGGDYAGFLTAAAAVRIKAGGDAADAAAGAGARTVTIVGLDQNWADASETVTLAGTSASSPTTTTFIRVFRAFVATTGTYGGTNTGLIVIETAGAVEMARIEATDGQTEMAITSIPAGKTGYLARVRITVGGSGKTMSMTLKTRINADAVAAPFGPVRVRQTWKEMLSGVDYQAQFQALIVLPAKSDVWFRGISQTQANSVSVSFDYYLIDD